MSRLIDKAILSDSFFVYLMPLERLCYLGLILIAEGTGCLEYDPRKLRNLIFPDPKDKVNPKKMEKMLKGFIEAGKLIPYAEAGGSYLFIRNFFKYQGQSKCPRPRLPLPPWLAWEPYKNKDGEDGYLGKVVFKGEPNFHQFDAHLTLKTQKMNYQCQMNGKSMSNQWKATPPEPASNQENFSGNYAIVRNVLRMNRIESDRIGKDIKGNQNENPSLSEKKETYPLSESQSSLNQSLKEQDRSKEEPTPQMLRYPPPTLQEGLEAIPDPEKRQRVREGIDEFLKTHCV